MIGIGRMAQQLPIEFELEVQERAAPAAVPPIYMC